MNSKKVIVTGGAGYLGRCAVDALISKGFHPIVLDNFSTSSRENVHGIESFEVDLSDFRASKMAFEHVGEVHAVLHFAAFALVGESVEKPEDYKKNNIGGAQVVADLCAQFKIPRLIHSSSCAVYGVPSMIPIAENSPQNPVSPYGMTKVEAEKIFNHSSRGSELKVLNLRYFNPSGALGKQGERHEPETHLIPRVVHAILNNIPITVYGNDYETPDGTCIRDFIHVKDLIDAHLLAMDWLNSPKGSLPEALNLGSGQGTSVLEVIRMAESTLNEKAIVKVLPRRPGDPAKLVADISLANRTFDWSPCLKLPNMIRDHYDFMKGET